MYHSETETLRASRLVQGSPIFYGWIILAAASLGMILTGPGQTYTVSIFIEHFIADLGISRSLVSTLYTVGTLGASFALPFIGRQIDVRGARSIAVIVTLLLGLACLYMGSIVNALMLGIGFVALRMFGQGALSLVSTNVVNQWWVRRRGMALGISNTVVALLGLGAFPSLVHFLVDGYGWRTAYPLLGLLVWVLMLPVGLLLFRDQPERYGLKPDGVGFRRRASEPMPDTPPEDEWTRAQAMGTPAFWIVLAGMVSISMLSTGLFFHAVSIFEDNGLSTSVAAAAFVPIAVTSAAVTLSSGILVDRLPVRFLLAGALVLQSVTLFLAVRLDGVLMAYAYGIILGSTMGLMRTVSSFVWADYFGRRHLGAIAGLASTFGVAGSALGPMPFGIARDVLGSYTTPLTLAAILPLLLALLALGLRKPAKESA